MKKGIMRKIISSIVTVMMMITSGGLQYAFAQPAGIAVSPDHLVNNEFVLSPEHGRVLERFRGSGKNTVVCIQDLHCHSEVQNNIAAILESLKEGYGDEMKVVSVEGAWGELDTSFVENIPKGFGVRERLVDELVGRGVMTGAEKFATESQNITIAGAEDSRLYNEDGELLVQSLELRKKALEGTKLLKDKLAQTKSKIYSKDQLEFEKLVSDHFKGQVNVVKYLNRLKQYSTDFGIVFDLEYPNLSKVLMLAEKRMRLGKMAAINKEANDVVMLMSKHLSKKEKSSLEMFKKEGSDRFYIYLDRLISRKNIAIKNTYALLDGYLEYVRLSQSINTAALVDEERSLQQDIREMLAVTPDQKRVVYLDKYINLLENYISNKITLKEGKTYLAEEAEFNARLQDFINRSKSDIAWEYGVKDAMPSIKGSIDIIKKFYGVAEKRNSSLVKHTLNAPRDYKKKTSLSVLIAGGYHSEGITELLRNVGVSYILISPNITQEVDDSVYYARLTAQAGTLGYMPKTAMDTYAILSMYQQSSLSLEEQLQNFLSAVPEAAGVMAQYGITVNSPADLQRLKLTTAMAMFKLAGLTETEFRNIVPIMNGKMQSSAQPGSPAIYGGEIKVAENGVVTITVGDTTTTAAVGEFISVSAQLASVDGRMNGVGRFGSAPAPGAGGGGDDDSGDDGSDDERMDEDVQPQVLNIDRIIAELNAILDSAVTPQDKMESAGGVIERVNAIQYSDEVVKTDVQRTALSDLKKKALRIDAEGKLENIKMKAQADVYKNEGGRDELNADLVLAKDAGVALMDEDKGSDADENVRKGVIISDIFVYLSEIGVAYPDFVVISQGYGEAMMDKYPVFVMSHTQPVSDPDEKVGAAIQKLTLDFEKMTAEQIETLIRSFGSKHGIKGLSLLINIKNFDRNNHSGPIGYYRMLHDLAEDIGINIFISLEKDKTWPHDRCGMMGMISRVEDYIGRGTLETGPVLVMPAGGSKTRVAEAIVGPVYFDLDPQQIGSKATFLSSLFNNMAGIMLQPAADRNGRVFIVANDQKFTIADNSALWTGVASGNDKVFALFGPKETQGLIETINVYLTSIGAANINSLNDLRANYTQDNTLRAHVQRYVAGQTFDIAGTQISGKKLTSLGLFFTDNNGALVSFLEKPSAQDLTEFLYTNPVTDIFANSFVDVISKKVYLGLFDALNIPVTLPKDMNGNDYYYNWDRHEQFRIPVTLIWHHQVSIFQTVVQCYFQDDLNAWMAVPHGNVSDVDWRYQWYVVHYKKRGSTQDDRDAIDAILLSKGIENADERTRIIDNMPDMQFMGAAVNNWDDVGSLSALRGSYLTDVAAVPEADWVQVANSNVRKYEKNSIISGEVIITGEGRLLVDKAIIKGNGTLEIHGDVVLQNTELVLNEGETLVINDGVAILNSRFSSKTVSSIGSRAILDRVIEENGRLAYSVRKELKSYDRALRVPSSFAMVGVPYKDNDGVVHFAIMFDPYELPYKGEDLNLIFSGMGSIGALTNPNIFPIYAGLPSVAGAEGAKAKAAALGVMMINDLNVEGGDDEMRKLLFNTVNTIFGFLSQEERDYIHDTLLVNNLAQYQVFSIREAVHQIMSDLYSGFYGEEFAFYNIGVVLTNQELINLSRFPFGTTQDNNMRLPSLGAYEKQMFFREEHINPLYTELGLPLQQSVEIPRVEGDRSMQSYGGEQALLGLMPQMGVKRVGTFSSLLEAAGLRENKADAELAQSIAGQFGVAEDNVFVEEMDDLVRPVRIGNRVIMSKSYAGVRKGMNSILTKEDANEYSTGIKSHEDDEKALVAKEMEALIARYGSVAAIPMSQIVRMLENAHSLATFVDSKEEIGDKYWYLESLMYNLMYVQKMTPADAEKYVTEAVEKGLNLAQVAQIQAMVSQAYYRQAREAIVKGEPDYIVVDVEGRNLDTEVQKFLAKINDGKTVVFTGDSTSYRDNLSADSAKRMSTGGIYVPGPATLQQIRGNKAGDNYDDLIREIRTGTLSAIDVSPSGELVSAGTAPGKEMIDYIRSVIGAEPDRSMIKNFLKFELIMAVLLNKHGNKDAAVAEFKEIFGSAMNDQKLDKLANGVSDRSGALYNAEWGIAYYRTADELKELAQGSEYKQVVVCRKVGNEVIHTALVTHDVVEGGKLVEGKVEDIRANDGSALTLEFTLQEGMSTAVQAKTDNGVLVLETPIVIAPVFTPEEEAGITQTLIDANVGAEVILDAPARKSVGGAIFRKLINPFLKRKMLEKDRLDEEDLKTAEIMASMA
ncbi:MAG: hypothetical protein ABH857_05445 [Elusimicrobiota bacterium]